MGAEEYHLLQRFLALMMVGTELLSFRSQGIHEVYLGRAVECNQTSKTWWKNALGCFQGFLKTATML